MSEPAKCVKKVVAPSEEVQKLHQVLAYAEENLSEGDYLIVAEALKKAHNAKVNPKPTPYKIRNIELGLVINCKDIDCCLHLDFLQYRMYGDSTPNDAILKYRTVWGQQERGYKTRYIENVESHSSCNELLVLVNNFIVQSNSMDITLETDDFEVNYDYEKTLEKLKKEKEVDDELNNRERDDDEEWEYDISDYHKIVAIAVKRFIMNHLC